MCLSLSQACNGIFVECGQPHPGIQAVGGDVQNRVVNSVMTFLNPFIHLSIYIPPQSVVQFLTIYQAIRTALFMDAISNMFAA